MAFQASDSDLPGVSYIMPVLNDVVHVRQAVQSLLNQDYRGPFDVTIAFGPSIDGTTELVRELSEQDPRIRAVPNPVGSTPAGLNVAIANGKYPIVIRVDAHSVLPANYARIAVETIVRTGADNVGGVMAAEGRTAFEKAVARAYNSRIGLGGSPHHVGGAEGPADTVYLGVFDRARLEEVGCFDERIKRGQDWELNRRFRETGGTVWFTPELRVLYRPRASLSRLARQFFSTGLWRGELAKRYAASRKARYFAPPVLVAGVALGSLAGLIGLFVPGRAGRALRAGFLVPAGYAALVAGAAAADAPGESPKTRSWLLAVLPTIHMTWGTGFLLGFAGLTRNIAPTERRAHSAQDASSTTTPFASERGDDSGRGNA